MLFVLRNTKLFYKSAPRVDRVGATVVSVCFFVINLFSHSNWVVQRALKGKEGVNHTS